MEKLSQRKEGRNPLIPSGNQGPLVVILGPTSSGKSSLAVRLAKKLHGEVVSADSRQLYKELSVGTGMISKKGMRGVPHHLLRVVSIKKNFGVAQYQREALKIIGKIRVKGKLPFLVGGSALYIYAVADGLMFPSVKPNLVLRKKLGKLSIQELQKKLKALDPQRAKTVDRQNPRRLIRAIEIVLSTKKPVPLLKKQSAFSPLLFIGIRKSPIELKKSIQKRVGERLRKGWVQETKKLLKSGVSQKQIREIGLGYQWMLSYLKHEISKEELVERIQRAESDFARRQMSWFRKDRRIHWIKNKKGAMRLFRSFL
ncbi:MAG: tRNA (adenosine(37)-N6)-dimethylallyltransferase MiaA [bacterium]|nr:tRNA (adenosine(37)-N6)-dimethylallyltransferase MiaA [bacterium]